MTDIIALRDQLRRERQAVAADKKDISRLSDEVEELSHRVLCESWRDRQQWRNIDLLMKTRISAAQCARRIQQIEKVQFQKYPLPSAARRAQGASPRAPLQGHSQQQQQQQHTDRSQRPHLTQELSEFFTLLMRHPEILARVLIYADSCKLDSGPLVEIALASVYGNYVLPGDEVGVLLLLDRLLATQLPACRQARLFFRGVACAFTRMLSLFCEGLFAAKTYLAGALRDCVRQLLADDERLFEFEPAKLCTRMSEEQRALLFDDDMRPLPGSESVWRDLELASAKVSSYCVLVLGRLTHALPRMPAGLRWLAARLRMHLLQLRVVRDADEVAPLLSDLVFGCFVSPALAMPEAAIVPVDTAISENARYNLTQVARILQGAASAALQQRRGHEMAAHLRGVYDKIDLNMFTDFFDRMSEGIDVNGPPPVAGFDGMERSNVYLTSSELSAVLTYFQKARLPLTSRGLPPELVPLLDTLVESASPDLDASSSSSSLSRHTSDSSSLLSPTADERAGRGRSVSTTSSVLSASRSLKERESAQGAASAKSRRGSRASGGPPSPQSRRLQRLRSDHFRPPTEVQVIPLQAAKPCGRVDLLSVQEVLRQAGTNQCRRRRAATPAAASHGEATSAELVDRPKSPQQQQQQQLGTAASRVVDEDSAHQDLLSGSSRSGSPDPERPSAEAPAASPADNDAISSPLPPKSCSNPSAGSADGGSGEQDRPSSASTTDQGSDGSSPGGEGNMAATLGSDSESHSDEVDGGGGTDVARRPAASLPDLRTAPAASPSETSTPDDHRRRSHPRSNSVCESSPVTDHPLLLAPVTSDDPAAAAGDAEGLGSRDKAKRSSGSSSGESGSLDMAHVRRSRDHERHATGSESSFSHDDGGTAVSTGHEPSTTTTTTVASGNSGAAAAADGEGLSVSLEQSRSATAADGKKLTQSDSYRDYYVISSPEELLDSEQRGSGGGGGHDDASSTISVWRRMAESQWSLGSMVRRGIVDAETGVSKLAVRTWENISKTAMLSGSLLRRMSINASTEILRARQARADGAGGAGVDDAWMTASQRDRFAHVTSGDAWEAVPLFNVLRWRTRTLLSEFSKTDIANYIDQKPAAATLKPPAAAATPATPAAAAEAATPAAPSSGGALVGSPPYTGAAYAGPLFAFGGHSYTLFDVAPECANHQVAELFRCLTQQLNSARYMNDRDACTTLHDTVNLLKQLPERGILHLMSVLQRDYLDRAQYHVYLYKVKQSLQAMDATLTSMLHHIERHQHCSLQFFMATCVRLFLERQANALDQFVLGFDEADKPADKAMVVENFLIRVYSLMDEDPMWSATQDQLYSGAQLAVERACFARVYDLAFRPNGDVDVRADLELGERIECLARVVTVRHSALQIHENFCQQAPWPGAVEALSHLGLYKTPYDKLAVVHACCQSIMRSLAFPCIPDSSSAVSYAFPDDDDLDRDLPGADDFFPVFVFVILATNPPSLVSTVNFVNTFQGNRLFGEVSYCWTQFCTALEFIKMIEL